MKGYAGTVILHRVKDVNEVNRKLEMFYIKWIEHRMARSGLSVTEQLQQIDALQQQFSNKKR